MGRGTLKTTAINLTYKHIVKGKTAALMATSNNKPYLHIVLQSWLIIPWTDTKIAFAVYISVLDIYNQSPQRCGAVIADQFWKPPSPKQCL